MVTKSQSFETSLSESTSGPEPALSVHLYGFFLALAEAKGSLVVRNDVDFFDSWLRSYQTVLARLLVIHYRLRRRDMISFGEVTFDVLDSFTFLLHPRGRDR